MRLMLQSDWLSSLSSATVSINYFFFFFHDTAPTEIYTLSLHDALPIFARVMRGPVLAEREKEYIEAVRALGAGHLVVALKHLLPNVLSPFVVQGTVAFSQAILIEASLSYLGLSAQPPTPSWGNMLNEGRTYLETAPWISVFPGVAIMIAVLAFNLIGDGLRDILDPNAS